MEELKQGDRVKVNAPDSALDGLSGEYYGKDPQPYNGWDCAVLLDGHDHDRHGVHYFARYELQKIS